MAKVSGGGLLFDIDGTLAETDPVHIRAFNVAMARFGVAFDEPTYKAKVMGRTNAAIFADVLPDHPRAVHEQVAAEKEAAFRRLACGGIEPMPGLLDLLDWAEREGVPCACVTNAPRLNAELILGALGLERRFAAVVLADDLAHGKPHPLPYLAGAERIGVPPGRCVAFEDSRSGVTSASTAGATTIGIMSGLSEPELIAAGACCAVRDFRDPRVLQLIRRTLGR